MLIRITHYYKSKESIILKGFNSILKYRVFQSLKSYETVVLMVLDPPTYDEFH